MKQKHMRSFGVVARVEHQQANPLQLKKPWFLTDQPQEFNLLQILCVISVT